MFSISNRNTAITIITEVLIFGAWALGSAFGWSNVEWVVGAITAAVAASVVRARGEYKNAPHISDPNSKPATPTEAPAKPAAAGSQAAIPIEE